MSRVLIVDDKEENAYYLQALLAGNGFEVDIARHGAEALVKARQTPLDLIICDLLMPVMDGYTLLRFWKADPSLRKIPFIVYTATYTEPEDERLALSLGADAFILKPSEPEDFLARIREVQRNAAGGQPTPPKFPIGDEKELLKVYSETLIRKLEEKSLQLQETNERLERDIAERKQTERALSESEKKFSKIFQSSPMGMALSTTKEGRYLDVNKEFLKILQRTREEVVGHTSAELGIWMEPGQREASIARLKAEGALRNVELEIHGRSGQVSHILWSVEEVEIGGESCLLGSSLDITERKRAETALIESNEKFNQLAENITDVFWIRSPDMSVVQYVSPAFESIWGRSVKEVYAQPLEWSNFIVPEDRERAQAAFALLTREARPLDIEYRISRPDGEIRWIRVRGFPVRNAAGTVIRQIGVVTDITARKQADDELRWKTAFLEAQVDSALDGILVVDQRGKKILQNERVVELWKIPPAIAASGDITEHIAFAAGQARDPQKYLEMVNYLYAHPDEISRDEVELKDGTILDRYSSPVRDKAGIYYGRIWFFRDITRQRKLEMQLRQSQKMEAFGQLAGGVAHDFNNILAVIQLQAGLLKSQQNLSLQQLDFAGEIEKAAERAANLTRQLLLFSRQQMMQPYDLNLDDIIGNIAKMLQRTLGEHIELQLKFSPEPIFIHADPGMIDQILLNLIVNARDAMPKGGKIIVETAAAEFDEVAANQNAQAREGSFACLTVSDNGGGIPPEIMQRIFEPFFTTKEVGKGTGLGLATVFGIVQQHQGWINVYSEVGRGSTFRVYLPRLTRAPDKRANWPSPGLPAGGRETILLVEDDDAVRSSVRSTLLRLGYQVLEASAGMEAFKVWKENRDAIHLLITDLMMPGGMTGKELANLISHNDPNLKVIYASGYSAEIIGKDFELKEGVNFLMKPFEAGKLAQAVRHCLDSSDKR